MSEINLKKNLAFTTSSQVITMAAAFVVNWFLARYLGPELRGMYVYLFTINSIVWMLLDLGISKSFVYSLQHDKISPNILYSFTLVFFAISLLVSIMLMNSFGYLILGSKISGYSSRVILALATYIALFQLYTRQKFILIGMNHIKDYSLSLIMPTVLFMLVLVPVFWLLPLHLRMEGSFLINVTIMAIVCLYLHFRIASKLHYKFAWNGKVIAKSYSLGYKAFLSEYMMILMIRVDVILLKQLGDFRQLGVYTLAINFLDMINMTANMIGVVLLNKFSGLKDDATSLMILRKIFVVMLLFDIVCILGMATIGLPVIRLLYSADYASAYYVFLYLSPAILGITLGGLFNTFLWSKGFPMFTVYAPAVCTALKTILAYFLIPRFGMFGAALSSSIVYPLWVIILMIWYFGTHKGQRINQLFMKKEDFSQIRDMILSLVHRKPGKAS
jgi:O-antigen/teichoic acid export membrane protein